MQHNPRLFRLNCVYRFAIGEVPIESSVVATDIYTGDIRRRYPLPEAHHTLRKTYLAQLLIVIDFSITASGSPRAPLLCPY